jgi:hypothetical protein
MTEQHACSHDCPRCDPEARFGLEVQDEFSTFPGNEHETSREQDPIIPSNDLDGHDRNGHSSNPTNAPTQHTTSTPSDTSSSIDVEVDAEVLGYIDRRIARLRAQLDDLVIIENGLARELEDAVRELNSIERRIQRAERPFLWGEDTAESHIDRRLLMHLEQLRDIILRRASELEEVRYARRMGLRRLFELRFRRGCLCCNMLLRA